MNIKLDSINSNTLKEMILNEKIDIPKEYYENSEIINLKDLLLKGKIYKNSADEIVLEGILSGVMNIEDSISLDVVDYEFDINIEEILENDQNTIDIIQILWQNIVLEVPLRFTKVTDYSAYSGDGWKLVSDGDRLNNNPFQELSKNFKEE